LDWDDREEEIGKGESFGIKRIVISLRIPRDMDTIFLNIKDMKRLRFRLQRHCCWLM